MKIWNDQKVIKIIKSMLFLMNWQSIMVAGTLINIDYSPKILDWYQIQCNGLNLLKCVCVYVYI